LTEVDHLRARTPAVETAGNRRHKVGLRRLPSLVREGGLCAFGCPRFQPPGTRRFALLLAATLLLTGCARSAGEPTSPAATGTVTFVNARPGSGLDFPLSSTSAAEIGIKQTIGHPAALLDADGDGLLDLLLAGPDRVALFRNLGGWRFQEVTDAGFRQKGYWQGVAVGDVDRDGRPDVYLSGFGAAALYMNRGGGRFRDATAASGLGGIGANRWLTSAAFADVDGDGWLDLYVTAYVELGDRTGVCVYPGGITTACAPTEFAPQRGALYRNLGGGRFADVTKAFGLQDAHGNGLGVAFGDPDDDGDPDLYIANDQRPCDLYWNENGRRFVNRGVASGTAFGPDGSPQAGMGVDVADYDGDGREDIVVTTYQREPTSLYRNDGGGLFTNATFASHLGAATTGAVGWGVKWADLDNDGRLDLAIANGHPLHRIREIDPATDSPQRFQIFRGQDGGRVAELTHLGSDLPRPIAGRALCAGDLDNDGRIDLLIGNIDGQPLLLRNTSPAQNHWLRVRLDGPRVTEGARVTLRSGAHAWTCWSRTGGSYLSAGDPRVHFGLGAIETVDSVAIRWPGGRTTVLRDVGVDQEVRATGH
jgi:hypothetical protein